MDENKTQVHSEGEIVYKRKLTFKEKFLNFFLPKGIRLDMLRYRPNKTSFAFSIFAIIGVIVGFCTIYSGVTMPRDSQGFSCLGMKLGVTLGLDILLNIILLLFMLSTSMLMKSYSIKGGIASICFGAFQIIRIFLFPLSLYRSSIMNQALFITVLVFYAASGLFSILAGFICVYRGRSLIAYLKTVPGIENEKVGK